MNKHWILTHLLPIFLVVIVVGGITIAAVPSFKQKFVGFISKFGPKADEVKNEERTQCNLLSPPVYNYEENRWVFPSDPNYILAQDINNQPKPMRKAIGGSLTISPQVVAVGQNITITAAGEGGFRLLNPQYNLYGNRYGGDNQGCSVNCYQNAPNQLVKWTEDGSTNTYVLKVLHTSYARSIPSTFYTKSGGWSYADINFYNDISLYVPYYAYWPEVTLETNKNELPYEVWNVNSPTINLNFMPVTDEFKSLEEKLDLPPTPWAHERFEIAKTFGNEKKVTTELTNTGGKYTIMTNSKKLGKYTIAVQPENTCISGGKEEFNFQVNALRIDISASPEKISNSGDESSKISIAAKKLTSEEDNGTAWSNKDLEIKFKYYPYLDNLEFFLNEPSKDEIGQSYEDFFGNDSVIKTDAKGESSFYIRTKPDASISEFGIPTGEVGITIKDKETGFYEGNTSIEFVSEDKLELKTCIVKPPKEENSQQSNSEQSQAIAQNNNQTKIGKVLGVFTSKSKQLAAAFGGIQIPWTSPSPTPPAPTGLFADYDCANDEEVKELSPDKYKDIKAALVYTNTSGDTQNNVTIQADFPKVNIDGKIVKFIPNNQSEFKPSKQTDNQIAWTIPEVTTEDPSKTILFDLEVVKSADSDKDGANILKIDSGYKIGNEKLKQGESWEKPIKVKTELPKPTIRPISIKHSGENTEVDYNTTANAENELYPGDQIKTKISFTPKQDINSLDLMIPIPDNTFPEDETYGDGIYNKDAKTLTWIIKDLKKDVLVEKEFYLGLANSILIETKTINLTAYTKQSLSDEKKSSDEVGLDIWGWMEGNVQGVNNHPVPNAYITLVDKDNKDISQQYDDGKDFQLTDDKGNYKLKFDRATDLLDENKVKIAVYLRDVKIPELALSFDFRFQNQDEVLLRSQPLALNILANGNFGADLNAKNQIWEFPTDKDFDHGMGKLETAQYFTETYYNFNFAKNVVKKVLPELKFHNLRVFPEDESGYHYGVIFIDQKIINPNRVLQGRNEELHEFGHYVRDAMLEYDRPSFLQIPENYYTNNSQKIDQMIEAIKSYLPPSSIDTHTIMNGHFGIINDFSEASVEEGFADFFSVAMEDLIENGHGDGNLNIMNNSVLIHIANTVESAVNDIPQRVQIHSSEEVAFASMLWTLWKGLPAQFFGLTTYSFPEVLQIFNNGQIVTVDQLYDTLNGQDDSKTQELFKKYGFCKTDEKNNWQCDNAGIDKIGSFANLDPFTISFKSFPGMLDSITIPFARPWRHFPPIIDSYIKTNFVENGQEKNGKLIVDIKFDPPYEFNSYNYEIDKLDSGEKIFLSLLGGFYHTKAYVRAEGSNDYFVMDSDDYLGIMGSNLDFNYLASQTFNINGGTPPTVDEIIAMEEAKNQEQPPTQQPTPTPTQDVSIPAEVTSTPTATTTQESQQQNQPSLTLTTTDDNNNETPKDDNNVKAGKSVDVKVENLTDASKIEVHLDNKKIAESPTLGKDFSFKVTLDKNTMIGTHTIKLLADNGQQAEVKIKVTENNWFNKTTGLIILTILILAAVIYFTIRILKTHHYVFHFRMK